jgi:hypothetical protein
MRTIASLLFGNDAGELLDLITGEGGITGERGITRDGGIIRDRGIIRDGGGGREAADRVLRSGEWCGSTPGRGSADRKAGFRI